MVLRESLWLKEIRAESKWRKEAAIQRVGCRILQAEDAVGTKGSEGRIIFAVFVEQQEDTS